MKKLLILIIILSNSTLFGQNLAEINENVGFADSLNNKKEIRIYRTSGMTNYTGVFRMYQDSTEKWRAELINHYAKVSNQAELKIEKRKLKSKSKMDLVWLEIQKTNIQDLPNMADINWKLKKEPVIHEMDGEKVLSWKQSSILDGEGFDVQIRWGKEFNRIYYSNPESYLRIYENVDELIYFDELLKLLRAEFGVWKNN
ncbi:hypothetical protein SAMN05192545_0992 [Maribacter dokdonensis]|uniref:GLPGLI family protein n=1 Tax=Maribacter dokdonensis TaxID=320912 RepID=A0ABY0U7Z4_9FLAO|nr:hypothetical protein [Maribacter dokdonensis]SDS21893.1 hypothetical protein SAMN05192545_0992 [Maribacter dokdonensis]